jgi:hypothetical protein
MSSLHISLLRQHGYSYVPADHPLLKLLADIAAANGVPIDLHMDAVRDEMKPPPRLAKLPNNPKIFPATLNALENLLSHNRQAIIVWAHGGSDHLGDLSATTVAGLIERHSNLHLSLRVSGPRAKTHNKLFSPGRVNANWLSLLKRFPDRFTIGSDNFYADPEGSGAIAEFSRNAEPRLRATATFLSLLPAYLAQKIGRDNAVRIYGFVDGDAPTMPASSSTPPASRGRCRDGNMAHCRIACSRGVSRACARLKRGK